MAKFINKDESLEAQKATIAVRKLTPQGIFKDNTLGILHKYKSAKYSVVTISEELSPKKAIRNTNSHLDLDDTLEAPVIGIYSKKTIKMKKEANYSSTHGIQKGMTRDYTHGVIEMPFRFALLQQ